MGQVRSALEFAARWLKSVALPDSGGQAADLGAAEPESKDRRAGS